MRIFTFASVNIPEHPARGWNTCAVTRPSGRARYVEGKTASTAPNRTRGSLIVSEEIRRTSESVSFFVAS
jgi:hypothetical protein